MALVDKAPRSATVTATEDSKLLAIKRRDFFDMIRKDHDVAVKLLWSFLGVLAQRLRNTSRELGQAREALAAEDLTVELLGESTKVEDLAGLVAIEMTDPEMSMDDLADTKDEEP
jgi:CRP-like cAMP-binding protein